MRWPLVPLGEIIKPAERELAQSQDLPVMSITMHRGLIDQHEKFKKRIASSDISTYKVVRRGNLVVGFPIDEGVLGFQQRYDAAAVSPAYGIWEVTGNHELDLDFFERVLRSPLARSIYTAKMRGTTNRRRTIPREIFTQIRFPLPPLAEQKRIAAILDAADALRAKRRESIEQLDTLLQSVFLDMFGDPVTNPKGWATSPLGELCDVRDGTHASPKYVKAGYPLLTSKNFKNGEVDPAGAKLISAEDFSEINRRSKVDIGDLVMPMIGTIGNPVLIRHEPDFAIKNVALIKFSDQSPDRGFLRVLLCSHYFNHATAKSTRGGTQRFVALKDLRGIPIPLPPADLQDHFSAIVAAVERQSSRLHAHFGELDTLFAALQSRAFNGEL